jgi:hypothetical protein
LCHHIAKYPIYERNWEMFDSKELTAAKESSHGRFGESARVSQSVKRMLYSPNYSDIEEYAIDMMAAKLGRIVCGDPHDPDHWRDIAGYASLVAQELELDRKAEVIMRQNGSANTEPSPIKWPVHYESTGFDIDL